MRTSSFNHELAITSGPFQLRGDYGERNNWDLNRTNQGFTIGINYYYNSSFDRSANYFKEHAKAKVNLTYSSVNLVHMGYEGDPRLDEMTGSSTIITGGLGLEWYFKRLDFEKIDGYSAFNPKNMHPYVAIMVGVSSSSPDAESSLDGGLENPDNIFPSFFGVDEETGINLESSVNMFFSFQTGVRFKLKDNQDLLLESSWVFFDSDFIEGLSPSGPQNESNDWTWGVNLGYAYTFY